MAQSFTTGKSSGDGEVPEAADFSYIPANIETVRARMAAAAGRAGVDVATVELVAVTKTMPAQAVSEALACGVRVFGENRVQELLSKLPEIRLRPDTRAHLIGHLQTNKVRQVIDKVSMIQSLDSVHLAREIDRQAAGVGRMMDVLIEVNVGDETSKSGVRPGDAADFADALSVFPHLRVCGMMAVPPFFEDTERARPYFAQMRKLFIDIGRKKTDNKDMHILSMGMSADFDIAIEEGANMVRVGTAIFGKRKYKEA